MTAVITDPLFNPLIFVGIAMLSIAFIYLMYRVSGERLYSVICIFLLLIAVGGSKIIPLFGHETNTGNIFYASVFLATYFLIERYGSKAGFRSVWIGVAFVAFFEVLLQLTLLLAGLPEQYSYNEALRALLGPSLRTALASVLAFCIAQSLNIVLFSVLRDRWQGKFLWLRANIANAIAQVFDGAVFFTVAFLGTIPPNDILDIAITGYLLKVFYMMAAAFILYMNTIAENENESKLITVEFLR